MEERVRNALAVLDLPKLERRIRNVAEPLGGYGTIRLFFRGQLIELIRLALEILPPRSPARLLPVQLQPQAVPKGRLDCGRQMGRTHRSPRTRCQDDGSRNADPLCSFHNFIAHSRYNSQMRPSATVKEKALEILACAQEVLFPEGQASLSPDQSAQRLATIKA
jgi:hypothetical protein